jgi:hypothetical protein
MGRSEVARTDRNRDVSRTVGRGDTLRRHAYDGCGQCMAPAPSVRNSRGSKDMEPTTLHDGRDVSMGQLPPVSPPPRNNKRLIGLSAAVVALLLAGGAIAAIFLATNNSVKPKLVSDQSANYHIKLAAVFVPLVDDNVALSKALQAIDGSRSTLRAAGDAAQTAQQAAVAARGAVAVLTAPDSGQTLNQQATQALTQEAGYLQAVNSTLADPTSNASGSLQSLASATNAAFVALSSVAPGGSASINGVDNLLSWVAGAQAAGKRAEQPKVVVTPGPTTTVTSPSSPTPAPSSNPAPSTGMRYCDQNIQADGQTTTCSLAENTFSAYWNSGNSSTGWGDSVVSAYSPKTGQSYDMTCSTDQTTVWCSGTAGSATLSVQFPMRAVEVYR